MRHSAPYLGTVLLCGGLRRRVPKRKAKRCQAIPSPRVLWNWDFSTWPVLSESASPISDPAPWRRPAWGYSSWPVGRVWSFQVCRGPGVAVSPVRPWLEQNVISALSVAIGPTVGSWIFSEPNLSFYCGLYEPLWPSNQFLFAWATQGSILYFINNNSDGLCHCHHSLILKMAWVLRNNK